MNAYWLHFPDGSRTDFHACGVCNKLALGEGNWDISERCCTCYECNAELTKEERGFANRVLYCRKCTDARGPRNQQRQLDKAELVTDYDGPVYLDYVGRGSYGDGYFENAQELSEHLDFIDGERPQFAFCCKSRTYSLDIDSALENSTGEFFEDAYDHLDGVDGLRASVDLFNELNSKVETWDPDYSRKVAVPLPPERSA